MIDKNKQNIKIAEERFVAWLTTQPKSHGGFYLEHIAQQYARYIRTHPPKLMIPMSQEERNVYACKTVESFDRLYKVFLAAPNFTKVNLQGHRSFSAGLSAYRRYVNYMEENGKTEMKEHEITVASAEESSRFAQKDVRNAFRTWLIGQHPEWCDNTVSMHCSEAYYLYNRKLGISLEEALTAHDGLQRAYNVIEKFYTANPRKKTKNPSGSARGCIRSLRMLKEFLEKHRPELLTQSGNTAVPATTIPHELIETLTRDYSSGFRFETTSINLLSNAAGIEVDKKMQAVLKRIMFRRDDDIHFLLDVVADAKTRKDIVDFADIYLEEYGFFEIPEFYKLYTDKVNSICIRNADDFASFYEQICKSEVRCVRTLDTRLARYSSGSVWGTLPEVATKIVTVISEEYYGSCNEDDLHTKFCAFSTDLLGKIIRQWAADDLIRVVINDSVCYQTYEALNLPENFSELLAEVVERMDEMGLTINRDALHTALSLKIGVNCMTEFNLPDWNSFQRLIAAFYKAEPHREWKHFIFGVVTP